MDLQSLAEGSNMAPDHLYSRLQLTSQNCIIYGLPEPLKIYYYDYMDLECNFPDYRPNIHRDSQFTQIFSNFVL